MYAQRNYGGLPGNGRTATIAEDGCLLYNATDTITVAYQIFEGA